MYYSELARAIVHLIEEEVTPLLGTEKAHEPSGKSAGGGLTKYIDRKAEDAVIHYLRDIDCQLITEESGITGEAGLKIVLDPLDGSINALSGIPFYSVSVAIWGETKYGLVKNLCTHDIYEAFHDRRPLKNGRPILPRSPEPVASGYIGEGFSRVLPLVESWRCLGSLALELVYVAAGNFLALVDLRKKARIVDIAGAQIIAEAAGLKVTDEKGNDPFAHGFFVNGTFTRKKSSVQFQIFMRGF